MPLASYLLKNGYVKELRSISCENITFYGILGIISSFPGETYKNKYFLFFLDSILNSRDITLPRKVRLVKAMVFPVVIYWCESWTIKRAECQRIDTFELRCWRRLLRVLLTARRSSLAILKEISLEYSLEGLMLKLKLLYFGHLMRRTDSLGKTLILGKIEGGRRRGRQRTDEMVGWPHWLDGHEFEQTLGNSKG